MSAQYRTMEEHPLTASVTVITCASSIDAFGLFSRERTVGARSGMFPADQSAVDNKTVYLRKGHVFIVIVFSSIPEPDTHIRDLISSIAGTAPPEEPLAPFLNALNPVSPLIYYGDSSFFVPPLDRVFTCKKSFGKTVRDTYVSQRSSEADALVQFVRVVKKEGLHYSLVDADAYKSAFYKKSSGEYMFAAQYKKWVFGIRDADSVADGKAAIHALYEYLKTQK